MPRRTPRPVPQWWRDASGVAFWAVLVVVVALWIRDGGIQDLGSLSGFFLSTGRVTGLVSSALLLIQVFLMARIPWFEQAWGQDELVRLHRVIGFTSFNLMLAHLVLIWFGYAGSVDAAWSTLVRLTLDYPGMLLAFAGFAALCLVVATSIKKARSRLRYESWHLIHLYGYLGAGLALPHQLWTGQEFLKSTVATVFWWGLYIVVALAVLVYRLGVPAWRSLRYPIRVVEVRAEDQDATTVTVAGEGLGRLKVRSGQFFTWRFMDGPGWSAGNPYSLSAAPAGNTLRFTAAHLGDGSARLAHLTPGTRVLIEGPYGRLHAGVRTRRKVLLIAAGIGIAPMRAILEDLDQTPGDVTVIHRIRDESNRYLGAELEALTSRFGARYIVVPGRRIAERPSWLPDTAWQWDDADALRHLVPDVADHDVFVVGATGWMNSVCAALQRAGVPATHIHRERFSW